MKTRKRHKRILFLMVSSQVLLTLFVFQWLRSQYDEEKKRLAGELTAFYIDAQEEMVDTLLFRSVVGPALRWSHDSSVAGKNLVREFVHLEGDKRQITVSVKARPDSLIHHDSSDISDSNKDMLLRSMKLIILHSQDSLEKNPSPVIRDLDIPPDTSVFKSKFYNRLEDAGLRFNIIWAGDPGDSGRIKKTLYLSPLNHFSLPGVSVKKYSGYLTRKILPQGLFGLLLVCLTALAFVLSYRSLRDHELLNDLRNEFISNMTHELKTPVSSIGIALESLSKYNLLHDPATADEYIQLAQSETKRLEDLVNRVLDHSVLEENITPLNITVNDLNALVHEITTTMQVRLMEKGSIDFNSVYEKINVKCDTLMVKGVIMNLIDNSIKYCDKEPEIRINAGTDAGYAILTISDNGPGIPEEYHDRIFEKFFRIPSGNVHNVKGYGLGLSFASLVMKLHNGTIAVRNHGNGCSFILKLPLA